jgi:hypothetical protein
MLGFFNHDICLQSINGSYITLILKIDNPVKVDDFRPISLLNNSIKLLTKLLANRLQGVILKIVHQNQYGFIKGRNIQDCLTWSFEYLHLCHKSRKERVILKLDFEKAFDIVEYEVILQVLSYKSFPQKLITWIRDIMGSGTSSVLLNGVPKKIFHCRRGVRQGGPLSRLLFVLAIDLLQSLITKDKDMGLLKLPINVGYTSDFPIIQYADDTLMIMKACSQLLLVLKSIMNTFADSVGLKVNYAKSSMIPISIVPDRLAHLATTFNCQAGSLPFTYLGLPLSDSKTHYL